MSAPRSPGIARPLSGAFGRRGADAGETAAGVPSTNADSGSCVHVTPQGNGPLAEIEFWRERNATLSALHEQTKLPIVRKVLEVIKEADSMLVANLQPVLTELFKLHMEASDNVRFLSTVERHFKVGGACHAGGVASVTRSHSHLISLDC